MGDHNITPIVTSRHRRNIIFTVDVVPGISVVDVIIVYTGGRRMHTAEVDGRGVDACGSGMSAMRPTESPSRRRRGESIC